MRAHSDTHMQGTHGEDVGGHRGPTVGQSHTCAHAVTFQSACDCLLLAQGGGGLSPEALVRRKGQVCGPPPV